MSYNSHHWGAPTASGQSTGEGGNAGGRYSSSLEMEPMISASGNTKGAGSPGSSKYHGKRTSPGSAGRMVLVTLACLAMLYFGYGVGRDDGLETAKQPNASPTPSLVRKPPVDQKNEEVKESRPEMPNDDDEPSDEDAEDDKMIESTNSAEEREEEGRGSDDADDVDDTAAQPDLDAPQENDSSKSAEEDPADAVTEDEAAREDDEDEDDDATQDFAPDGDSDDGDDSDENAEDNDDAVADNADTDDDDEAGEGDDDTKDDDNSTEDFDNEDKDGHVDTAPKQSLEDDDSVVDDDAVSKDTDDDDPAASADDDAAGSSDDDQEDDANAIAKKLVPNGVSDTPTTAYQIPDTVHNRFVKWSKELHQISEMEEYKGGEPRVNWEWHPRKRADRFPGVDDRVSSFTFDNTTG